ncbi:cytosolic leucyl tRNA synthetase, partial [Coelomomyces lativittatus]
QEGNKNVDEKENEDLAEDQKGKSTTKVIKKHSKAIAKSGAPNLYQWQIMESLGIPREDIHQFSDPSFWLTYFPPLAQQDLTNLGFKVDWRRSFITTRANPYYDAFIRWQFNKLKVLNKIKFGERYTIWSPLDQQPCMDHDRQTGEGVGPQEYVGIKLKLLIEKSQSSFAQQLRHVPWAQGKQIFLIAATLRPETMFGQTNCYVGSNITYGVYAAHKENELFIVTEHAARNMSFQGLLGEKKGVWTSLANVQGKELLGCAVVAPFSPYPHVFVLPLEHVIQTKGTGIVTSVPSDSPDDLIMLRDLKKKPDYYGIQSSWVDEFNPISIIKTPTFGDLSAETALHQFKIQSPKHRDLLDKAKEAVYKESFYAGTMLVKGYEGMSIELAKPLIKKKLLDTHQAVMYCEPEKDIVSRSGDRCVVNLCDQWYLDYGEPGWLNQAKMALENLETYHVETKHVFSNTLNWLNQWACARSFGLGTLLPWDPQFVIESLSDSTIYMAYYTVCHFLHEDVYGQVPGSLKISSDSMTDEVWEYIFNELAPYPTTHATKCGISKSALDAMRASFTYFYPLDLRTTGKDLVSNHLTFFLYNHCCLFDEKYWPKAVRLNGHLLLNSEKMSKSLGNFMTVAEALEKFGADATRITMADAGDSVEDANFVEATANAAILRLHTQRLWVLEMLQKLDTFRTGPYELIDTIFLNQMYAYVQQTEQAYQNMLYRDALKYGFFEFQESRYFYREFVSHPDIQMHRDLVMLFIRLQTFIMTPIIPHWCEHVWRNLLNEPTSVVNQPWPVTPTVDFKHVAMLEYLKTLTHALRTGDPSVKKPSMAHQKQRQCTLFVAPCWLSWQSELIQYLATAYEEKGLNAFSFENLKLALPEVFATHKKAMSFVNELKLQLNSHPPSKVFQLSLEFDEIELIHYALPWLSQSLQLDLLKIVDVSKTSSFDIKEHTVKASLAIPGVPGFVFQFV